MHGGGGGAYTWTTFGVFGGEIEHGKYAHYLNVFVKLQLDVEFFYRKNTGIIQYT